MGPKERDRMLVIPLPLPRLYSPTYVLQFFSLIPSPPPLPQYVRILDRLCTRTPILSVFLAVLPRCAILRIATE